MIRNAMLRDASDHRGLIVFRGNARGVLLRRAKIFVYIQLSMFKHKKILESCATSNWSKGSVGLEFQIPIHEYQIMNLRSQIVEGWLEFWRGTNKGVPNIYFQK